MKVMFRRSVYSRKFSVEFCCHAAYDDMKFYKYMIWIHLWKRVLAIFFVNKMLQYNLVGIKINVSGIKNKKDNNMGYKKCLELAGAVVIDYEEFGSYQGDWLAYVEYKGKKGFIKDYYGSCSGCDAYEAEFGFHDHDCVDEKYYSPHYSGYKDNCKLCQAEKLKAIKFGEDYLENILSYDEVLKNVSENLEWDGDANNMLEFVKKHRQ